MIRAHVHLFPHETPGTVTAIAAEFCGIVPSSGWRFTYDEYGLVLKFLFAPEDARAFMRYRRHQREAFKQRQLK